MPDRNPPTLVELKTMFHCEDEASEESTWSNVMTSIYLWQDYEIICCVAAWKVEKIFSKNSGFIILSPSPDVYGTYSPDWSPVAHFSKSNPSWAEQEKQESMRKNSLMTVCFCRALKFSVILALLVAYYLQRCTLQHQELCLPMKENKVLYDHWCQPSSLQMLPSQWELPQCLFCYWDFHQHCPGVSCFCLFQRPIYPKPVIFFSDPSCSPFPSRNILHKNSRLSYAWILNMVKSES